MVLTSCLVRISCFLSQFSKTLTYFQVIKLKEKGNACVREEKYEEAIFHYSHALKLDPLNYSIYSNRSLAFLKMQQYYLSMDDALQTIKIAPEWAKVRTKLLKFDSKLRQHLKNAKQIIFILRDIFGKVRLNLLHFIFRKHYLHMAKHWLDKEMTQTFAMPYQKPLRDG